MLTNYSPPSNLLRSAQTGKPSAVRNSKFNFTPPALKFLFLYIPGLGLREEVKARDGESVSLPCVVNRAECGDFHSIKWYKENRRVFVYSPLAEFAKAEGELIDRYVRSIGEST